RRSRSGKGIPLSYTKGIGLGAEAPSRLRRNLLSKAIERLVPALIHTREVRGCRCCRFRDARMQRQFSLAAVLGERHGGEYLEERIAVFVQRGTGEDEPLGLDDLMKNSRHRVDDAVRATHV